MFSVFDCSVSPSNLSLVFSFWLFQLLFSGSGSLIFVVLKKKKQKKGNGFGLMGVLGGGTLFSLLFSPYFLLFFLLPLPCSDFCWKKGCDQIL